MLRRSTLALILLHSSAHAATLPLSVASNGVDVQLYYLDPSGPLPPIFGPYNASRTENMPWTLEVSGHVNTDAATWSFDSLAFTPPASDFAAQSGLFDVNVVVDPPGFDPPITTLLEDVSFEARFEWGAASITASALTVPFGPWQGILEAPFTLTLHNLGRLVVDYSGGTVPYQFVGPVEDLTFPAHVYCTQGSAAVCEFDDLGLALSRELLADVVLMEGATPQPASFQYHLLSGLNGVATPVPEPSAALLVLLALIGLLAHVSRWDARRARVQPGSRQMSAVSRTSRLTQPPILSTCVGSFSARSPR